MKRIKVSTSIYQHFTFHNILQYLSVSTVQYFLSESTSIHQHPPVSTSIYQYLPVSTSIYQYLPVSTSICHLQREKKHRKRYIQEISLSLYFYLVYRYSTKFINSTKYFTTNDTYYKTFFMCIDAIIK